MALSVVGVADRSDRPENVVVVKNLLEGQARVLRAGVAVMDEVDVGAVLAASQGHAQCVQDGVGAHVRREPPADDPPHPSPAPAGIRPRVIAAAEFARVRRTTAGAGLQLSPP